MKKLFFEFFISFQVLKMMVGTNLKDTQLQQVVDKTMRSVDRDQDGKISFEEFCQIVDKTDFDKKAGAVAVSMWDFKRFPRNIII